MKRMTFAALALLIAPAILAQAEHGRRGAARTILADDDDGKVEVWRRGDIADPAAAVAPIRQPLFELIFAGAGWTQSSKDAVTSGLRQLSMPQGISPAAIAGTREIAAAGLVNDLAIQSLIDRAMRSGSLPLYSDNTIPVVLLSPAMRSTLGAFKAGIDYDSYHSHFHSYDVDVRYVVVPWHDDAAALREAVANSALRAVLNAGAD